MRVIKSFVVVYMNIWIDMHYIFEKNVLSETNHHSPRHVSHWNESLEGTFDGIVSYYYVSVLSLALLYVFAERLHVNVCMLFDIETICFNLFNYYSFAIGRIKHSVCLLKYMFCHHNVQMSYFKYFQL